MLFVFRFLKMAESAPAMIDPDLHMCMCCSTTILGLDKYVKHKQYECPALHKQYLKPSNTCSPQDAPSSTTTAAVIYPKPGTTTPGLLLAQYAKSEVSPSEDVSLHLRDYALFSDDSVVSDDELTASDLENFLRSLELRSSKSRLVNMQPKIEGIHEGDFINGFDQLADKDASSTITAVQDYLKGRFDLNEGSLYEEDQSKSLQMACLLTNLEFDSDNSSDELIGSDGLLDFTEDDDESLPVESLPEKTKQSQSNSSTIHTHGGNTSECSAKNGKKEVEELKNNKQLGRGTVESKGWNIPASGSKVKKSTAGAGIGKCIPGKWRPGEKPNLVARRHSSRGKWQSPEGDEVDDDKTDIDCDKSDDETNDLITDIDNQSNTQHQPVTEHHETVAINDISVDNNDVTEQLKELHSCEICKRTFLRENSYRRHLDTPYHRKRSGNSVTTSAVEISSSAEPPVREDRTCESNQTVETEEGRVFSCLLCTKDFYSKYSLARHMVSQFHIRRLSYNTKHNIAVPGMPLGESVRLLILRLRPFQCRICESFLQTSTQLSTHLNSAAHCAAVRDIVGPFLCVRCSFTCQSNVDMVQHVASESHLEVVRASVRPCVLKEQRVRVKCGECDKNLRSAGHLVVHMKSEHSKKTKLKCNSLKTTRRSTKRRSTNEQSMGGPSVGEGLSVGGRSVGRRASKSLHSISQPRVKKYSSAPVEVSPLRRTRIKSSVLALSHSSLDPTIAVKKEPDTMTVEDDLIERVIGASEHGDAILRLEADVIKDELEAKDDILRDIITELEEDECPSGSNDGDDEEYVVKQYPRKKKQTCTPEREPRDGPYVEHKCKRCKMSFKSAKLLLLHRKTAEHIASRRTIVKRADLMKTEDDGNYSCPYCSYMGESFIDICKHKIITHLKESTQVSCCTYYRPI